MFLENYKSVFTDEDIHLYINNQTIKCFHKDGITIKSNMIGFSTFLENLQELVVEVIYDRRIKFQCAMAKENVFSAVNVTILQRVELRNERIRKVDRVNLEKIISGAPTIYIYDSFNRMKCIKDDHYVTIHTLSVVLLNSLELVDITVHYCEECKEYFVGQTTLELFQKKHGAMLLRISCEKSAKLKKHDAYWFAEESELHKWGYNVIEGALSVRERQNLLRCLIDFNQISYVKICRDIQNAINIFRSRVSFENAVSKWAADLEFISDYVKSKPEGIGVLKIANEH